MNAAVQDLDSLTDDQFRSHVRSWIQDNYPPELRNPPKRLHFSENKPWYMALANQGWLAPNWPAAFGGMGISASKQLIFLEEKERHGCCRLNDMGMTMIGPLLIKFGRPEQQQHFLPKILAGEHIWCQGYSEPNAGSDLASLRTEAVLDGDHWVVHKKIDKAIRSQRDEQFAIRLDFQELKARKLICMRSAEQNARSR